MDDEDYIERSLNSHSGLAVDSMGHDAQRAGKARAALHRHCVVRCGAQRRDVAVLAIDASMPSRAGLVAHQTLGIGRNNRYPAVTRVSAYVAQEIPIEINDMMRLVLAS
ncbi:hypothetical protein LGH82_31135 [Mesorhizobium sp. PAMC28654]|uniref:hypothetical protein n=1 Tax=Mesorhizobium sp. PAMC28654 TaxID=2880934 RepID=UPI001D0B3BFB|nr:hypothetical protein [Mesorhizobium sp. PAMC28654]UDL89462.1 hypothetical protein LGH82_31135 [Mesorhizobium sp. PAMC28654]